MAFAAQLSFAAQLEIPRCTARLSENSDDSFWQFISRTAVHTSVFKGSDCANPTFLDGQVGQDWRMAA